jgi:hypothetical protein
MRIWEYADLTPNILNKPERPIDTQMQSCKHNRNGPAVLE